MVYNLEKIVKCAYRAYHDALPEIRGASARKWAETCSEAWEILMLRGLTMDQAADTINSWKREVFLVPASA